MSKSIIKLYNADCLDILKDIHPGRDVIGIPAKDILLGGGNIHCITQQIPAYM